MLRWYLSLLLSVLVAASIASAAVVTVPLPELEGAYGVGTSRVAFFDLGHALLNVNGARMEWSGTITPGLGHGDGVLIPADEWFPWPTRVAAFMDPPEPGMWHATAGPADGFFAAQSPFEPFLSPGWDFLLGGIGEVQAQLEPAIILGGVLVIPPQATVGAAVLALDVDWEPTMVSEARIQLRPWTEIKTLYR